VAERIATPLKRAGVETPILEEIPHKAEEISTFYYQAEQYGGQLELLRLPAFAHGKAYGETAGFWYRVTFPKPINNPSVSCIPEARTGEIPQVKMPTIGITRVPLPKIAEIKVPTDIGINPIPVGAPKFTYECTGPLCGFSPYKEITELGQSIASVLNEISDKVMEEQNRVNQVIFRINDALKKIIDTVKSLDAKVDDLRTKVDEAVDTLRLNAENSVNDGLNRILPALYTLWGLPKTMAATPIHVRNVTSTGFEFQSLGKTTIWWIAIGTRA
jgi:hypothetical protein